MGAFGWHNLKILKKNKKKTFCEITFELQSQRFKETPVNYTEQTLNKKLLVFFYLPPGPLTLALRTYWWPMTSSWTFLSASKNPSDTRYSSFLDRAKNDLASFLKTLKKFPIRCTRFSHTNTQVDNWCTLPLDSQFCILQLHSLLQNTYMCSVSLPKM